MIIDSTGGMDRLVADAVIIGSVGGLDRLVADGKITEHDAVEVRDFAELLRSLKTPGKGPRTTDELRAMAKYNRDRDPEFYAKIRWTVERRNLIAYEERINRG